MWSPASECGYLAQVTKGSFFGMDGKLLPLILNSRQSFDRLAGKILRCNKNPNIVVALAAKGDRSVGQMAALRNWQH
jgi:hypothetical protein